jgi:ABC-type nitrate/sulfonate/bicarbonate transport system substrate-binding protein
MKLALLALLVILVVSGCQTAEPDRIVMSYTGNPDNGLVLIAEAKGYFAEQGLDVTFLHHNSGKASLAAVIGNEADFGLSAELPIVLSAMQNEDFYILAKIIDFDESEAVIARIDANITTVKDLQGRRVGTFKNTSAEFFLDSILVVNGVQIQDISVVNMVPGDMESAIIKEEVDAVSIWQPFVNRIKNELGERGIIFYGEGSVRGYNFYLIASGNMVRQNPDTVLKLMRALEKAEKYLVNYPDQSVAILSDVTKNDKDFITAVYSPATSMKLVLDQAMLLTLEDQSRWASNKNLTSASTVPNYLDYISIDALREVKPNGITLIR